MTGDDDRTAAPEKRGDEPPRDDGPPAEPAARRGPSHVPDPEPEEAPELLGERSDYPIVWDGEES